MSRTGDVGAGELALCSLAIEAPLLLPPSWPRAATVATLHVALDLRGGGMRLQSSAEERRCAGLPAAGLSDTGLSVRHACSEIRQKCGRHVLRTVNHAVHWLISIAEGSCS
jgi:hypothetical protein